MVKHEYSPFWVGIFIKLYSENIYFLFDVDILILIGKALK